MGKWQGTIGALAVPQHTAVLLIDVQEAFTSLPGLFPTVTDVLSRLRTFLDVARATGVLVVHARLVIPRDAYSMNWQRQFAGSFRAAMAPGAAATAFAEGFEPRAEEVLITKHRYSAFYGTPLASVLRTRGIRTVILGGLTTDVCVGSTARDAYQEDFQVVTLADGTAEVTRAQHEAALATLEMNFGIVCSAEDVVAAWQRHTHVSA
jgi:ureidoacrylate peracid hydrolase